MTTFRARCSSAVSPPPRRRYPTPSRAATSPAGFCPIVDRWDPRCSIATRPGASAERDERLVDRPRAGGTGAPGLGRAQPRAARAGEAAVGHDGDGLAQPGVAAVAGLGREALAALDEVDVGGRGRVEQVLDLRAAHAALGVGGGVEGG